MRTSFHQPPSASGEMTDGTKGLWERKVLIVMAPSWQVHGPVVASGSDMLHIYYVIGGTEVSSVAGASLSVGHGTKVLDAPGHGSVVASELAPWPQEPMATADSPEFQVQRGQGPTPAQ